jgi:transketolase N-terminal domain/subunit
LIRNKAEAIRRNVVLMLKTDRGHLGGSLSIAIADMIAALYFGVMIFDPQNPRQKTATGSFSARGIPWWPNTPA